MTKPISDKIYSKIAQLSQHVIDSLRKKGIAIPTENSNGTVQIGDYALGRETNGYYFITNNRNELVVKNINLPQSAVVIANNLAVGKGLDSNMINADRDYGYAVFEEQLLKQSAQRQRLKNPERADIIETKCLNSQIKRQIYKKQIIRSFEKLKKFA